MHVQERYEALVVKEQKELHYSLSVLMLIVAELLVVLHQDQELQIPYLLLFAYKCD